MSNIPALTRHFKGWRLSPLQPRPASSNLVRVNIALAGLCRTDIQCMSGALDVTQGRVLGHEAAGWVDHIPPSLKTKLSQKGIEHKSRVAFFPFLPCGQCPSCKQGVVEMCYHHQAVGVDCDGAFAPFIDLPEQVLFAAPSNLSWKHLAYAEPVSAAMAVAELPITPQDQVAVVGRGRIGRLTCRVLEQTLLRPVALVDPDACATPACAYDVVVETWPTAPALSLAAHMLRHGGLLVAKSRPAAGALWPHKEIVMKCLRVLGAPYGSFQKGLDWMASHRLQVDDMFGTVYPWSVDGVEQALQQEKQFSEQSGKIFFDICGHAQ